MSKKGRLTRDDAVEIVGDEAVIRVLRENCEPTNRVGYNGACQGDELTEWCVGVLAEDYDGCECMLLAYYYTTNEQDKQIADADGDMSVIDWKVEGFEVV